MTDASGATAVGAVQTLAGRVFDRLRSDILTCRLLPYARLRLEELRDRYNAGFSPLREALMRLEAEGLVVLAQNRGFRVAPVSPEHLIDLTKVRAEVDCLALRWSIEQGDIAWEGDIISAFHRLARNDKIASCDPVVISDDWQREHRAFHGALTAACGSPLLQTMCSAMFDQSERYVSLSIQYLQDPRDDVAEHEGLMRAAIARDAATACDLMQQHIGRTTEKVLQSLEAASRDAGRNGQTEIGDVQ